MNKLVFNTTTACNLNCKTCLREGAEIGHLDMSLLEKALPQAKKLGCAVVALTGGEPCLHPDFEDLVEMVIKSGLRVQFVTNGTMMHRYRFIFEKYRKKIVLAAVSLDGATSETQERVRGVGTFDTVLESISYLVSQKVYTKVQMCLNRLNMHDIEDIYWLCMRKGISHLSYISAISTPANLDIVLTPQEKQQCVLAIRKLVRLNKMRTTFSTSLRAPDKVHFCSALGIIDPFVNTKGELVPCCDLIGDGPSVGSLYEHDLLTLYNRCIDVMSKLKQHRACMMADGRGDLNGCEMCNAVLSRMLAEPQSTEPLEQAEQCPS